MKGRKGERENNGPRQKRRRERFRDAFVDERDEDRCKVRAPTCYGASKSILKYLVNAVGIAMEVDLRSESSRTTTMTRYIDVVSGFF